ncbi:glycosyltransferase family 2 protein [Neomegalonema sp.]|uniref:glycosyltransferase family 2 protein n=1 Tax=Neomegalonema sp. TaxID=2039713 RepID=UPI00262CCAD6|nr:glycosyltransferase family 2 protein [Neomegalonema sp.]MDD2870051.1 glycosyltransferase [Neomegalonema sp.]
MPKDLGGGTGARRARRRRAARIRHLLAALQDLDYPRDRLEVLILLEQDDLETFAAFLAQDPPPWIRLLVAPDGAPRTKPRALNWGLAEAKGGIVGVFDAEDRPEPDQLRKAAAAFAQAPPEVVCLQARLGWYNASTNGLTRGLALEYAGWFGLLLPALARLGWPIPLGGTSCYLRAGPLREIGGWDPWNVTEDADLGFRLARRGWRSATLDSTTWEEAVLTPHAWIRQRTRWIKGFLVTWIVHMRDPLRLWREIGPAGFWVLNALTLGSFLAYLSLPLHLTALAWLLVAGEAPWSEVLPEKAGRLLAALFWAGLAAATFMAFRGAWRSYGLRFACWAPLLPFYLGIFGPVAALRAASQLPRSAFLWEKTAHGFDQGALAPSPADAAPAGRQASRGAV